MHAAAGRGGQRTVLAPGECRPLGDMVDYLAGRVGSGGADGDALEFVADGRKRHVVSVGDFAEIPGTDRPRRIAFVDGGNATLAEAPSFMIGMNRVYYSVFRGDQRQRPARQPRIEFFSCVTAGGRQRPAPAPDASEKGAYTTRLFARNAADRGRLPADADLDISSEDVRNSGASRDMLMAIPRRMAEWAVAGSVVDAELRAGDVLVMDGTLQTRSKRETQFVEPICRTAAQKGVVLCGLAKTSTLVTADNLPLIGRASELAEAAGLGGRRWFVGVCDRATNNDMGYTYIARFHERSRYVFRFGVLGVQRAAMSGAEVESVLASIAANSRDISMPGYPYGAIDADRFAKVRNREATMHRNMLDAEIAGRPGGDSMAAQIRSMSMHQALNRVTG